MPWLIPERNQWRLMNAGRNANFKLVIGEYTREERDTMVDEAQRTLAAERPDLTQADWRAYRVVSAIGAGVPAKWWHALWCEYLLWKRPNHCERCTRVRAIR